jgi:hypothetical protein
VQEAYLWGHATIEDFLYQPKNDHLLFAYLGISLQIRRQKLSFSIRRTVALKRKLSKAIQNTSSETPIVIRDIDDKRYPYTEGKNLLEGNFLWLPCYSKGISYEGLRVVCRRYFAYFDHQRKQWDYASGVNLAYPPRDKNPWYDVQSAREQEPLTSELRATWMALPRLNQRQVLFIGVIPYEDIIEVDDVPDIELKILTVFVTFQGQQPPFAEVWDIGFDRRRSRIDEFMGQGEIADFHKSGHVRLFPDKFRDLKWEQVWFAKKQITYATKPHHLDPMDKDSRSGMPIPD